MAQEKGKEESPQTPEQIIAEFDEKNVIEQIRSIVDYSDRIKDSTAKLELKSRIKHKVNFLQSIKHQVLTRRRGMADLYNNASLELSNFIEFLKESGIDKKIEELNDTENLKILNDTHKLLEGLIVHLNLQQEELGGVSSANGNDLENVIKEINNSMANSVGLEEERKQEKKITKEIAMDLGKQAELFETKSNEYRKNSAVFLRRIIFIVILIFISPYIYDWLPKINEGTIVVPKTKGDYLYFYLALKLIFSAKTLLSVAMIIWLFACIRFYAASNHNAIICDQRANTLKSYKALRTSAEKDEERQLILQKVLDSATEHQVTGFSKQEGNDSGNVISKIASDLFRLLKR